MPTRRALSTVAFKVCEDPNSTGWELENGRLPRWAAGQVRRQSGIACPPKNDSAWPALRKVTRSKRDLYACRNHRHSGCGPRPFTSPQATYPCCSNWDWQCRCRSCRLRNYAHPMHLRKWAPLRRRRLAYLACSNRRFRFERLSMHPLTDYPWNSPMTAWLASGQQDPTWVRLPRRRSAYWRGWHPRQVRPALRPAGACSRQPAGLARCSARHRFSCGMQVS